MMKREKNPWTKFYWKDWDGDERLRFVSLAAQGLWMRMLCIMAKSEPVGYLRIAGVDLTVEQLAAHVGQPFHVVDSAFQELRQVEIFSISRSGVPFSRRLIRDEKRRKNGQKSAQKRWSQDFENIDEKQLVNGSPNSKGDGLPITQSPESRVTTSASALENQGMTALDEHKSPSQGLGVGDVLDCWRDEMSDAGLSVPPRPPRSNEIDAARRWIASGASLDQLRDIFRQGIHGKRALGEQAPSSLAWFDKRVEAAVKTEADTTDQWRRRVELFKQHGVEGWPQSWGRPPTDPLCEAPAEIVRAVLGA